MKSYLALLTAVLFFHSQLALAEGGCSLPMFGGARLFPSANSSQAFAIGDFNADGFPDVAVANLAASSVSILLGLGDGTFKSGVNLTVRGPSDIVTADFNGDGKLDLTIWDSGTFTIITML